MLMPDVEFCNHFIGLFVGIGPERTGEHALDVVSGSRNRINDVFVSWIGIALKPEEKIDLEFFGRKAALLKIASDNAAAHDVKIAAVALFP